ncbi:nucleotide exchange factor GrpE [Desnuesiella massiliensis]|uniref:nucleotide exchange factor GrpE n=1 Tax=Desnuesiella massiliensis TaxID=1650662 RepID=UPI000B1FD15E
MKEMDNKDNLEAELKNEQVEKGNIKEQTIEENWQEAEKLEDEEFETVNEEQVSKVQEENAKLYNEVEVLKDRLLRISAEYDNFRKRTAKEKEGIYSDACTDVLKNMLPVLDNLERAVSVEGNLDDLKKGIDMTLRQFKDSLKKLNVEEISTEEGFDPNYHNAVMHMVDENYGKNEIVEVFQKGYKRENKVIRYSMVKVAN